MIRHTSIPLLKSVLAKISQQMRKRVARGVLLYLRNHRLVILLIGIAIAISISVSSSISVSVSVSIGAGVALYDAQETGIGNCYAL